MSRSLSYSVDINQINIILGYINKSIVHVGYRKSLSVSREKPLLDNYVVWIAMVGKKNVDILETGQKKATSMISGLENLTCTGRLKWLV